MAHDMPRSPRCPGGQDMDGPGLTHFGFKVRKLFKSATAHRSFDKSHLIVLHLGMKKFEQIRSDQ